MTNNESERFLSGQVAVVTGGGRGIGREIARQLAAVGARVVVTARTLSQLEETRELIASEGGLCSTVQMDVLDEVSVSTAFREILEVNGHVDLLVNNAGISGKSGAPWELDTEDWWRTMEVNLRGPYLCSKVVIPDMIERKRGRIIMVGSNMAFWPYPVASAYSCSKAGLVRLGDNLAVALKEHGIAVFTISPGLVRTEMTKDIPEEFVADAEWTPIEKPAELCVALASGKADALTGRYIHSSEHDLDELIARAEEIEGKNLQTMRLVE
ncbi:SDR family oxidoreductase [Puniceicoccales bacterium CK1056]|uniref:SDR family oxidoreductase n=1 Tax=Oceanipulchritudo coccoides TaxID=2706888 RepID=A0A6B2LZV0_9BACT|nr:SDR family oxidoreductase [Oceanipulchritudo coccoides]NDV61454.1 SDR family oxidoreductase [Oceanipulchritudo coccoides]